MWYIKHNGITTKKAFIWWVSAYIEKKRRGYDGKIFIS